MSETGRTLGASDLAEKALAILTSPSSDDVISASLLDVVGFDRVGVISDLIARRDAIRKDAQIRDRKVRESAAWTVLRCFAGHGGAGGDGAGHVARTITRAGCDQGAERAQARLPAASSNYRQVGRRAGRGEAHCQSSA